MHLYEMMKAKWWLSQKMPLSFLWLFPVPSTSTGLGSVQNPQPSTSYAASPAIVPSFQLLIPPNMSQGLIYVVQVPMFKSVPSLQQNQQLVQPGAQAQAQALPQQTQTSVQTQAQASTQAPEAASQAPVRNTGSGNQAGSPTKGIVIGLHCKVVDCGRFANWT